MVIKERTLIAGAAALVGLMIVVAAWKHVSAPATTSAPAAPRTATAFSPEKIQTISTGEEVDLAAHMPDSGRTVVEFTADW